MPRPTLKFSTEPPGRRLGLVRQRLTLRMESMAATLGVSAQAISDLEADKSRHPKADLLASCATNLGVRLDWLLLGQGPMLYRDEQATRRQ